MNSDRQPDCQIDCPFGGLMGPLGSELVDCSSWDMDKVQQYGGWNVGQILARSNLLKTFLGDDFGFGGLFPSF